MPGTKLTALPAPLCAPLILSIASCCFAEQVMPAPQAAPAFDPSSYSLTLQQQPESIYAPPAPPREEDGVNEGAVHVELTVRYLTDYVYRGIDKSEIAGEEDSPNLQFDGKLDFDLGKLPHPYIGLFVNVYDSDPISRFQEVRPVVGFDWPIRPITFSAGHLSYIFPDREDDNTSEVFAQVTLDDGFLWSTERPILSPYVYGAYDYDLYKGWYLEAGVKRDFIFEETGLTLTLLADVAWVYNHEQFSEQGSNESGFQHYDVGLISRYSLNNLLNISRRYGEFAFEGYLFYTDGIENDLNADTQLWGGLGINFRY